MPKNSSDRTMKLWVGPAAMLGLIAVAATVFTRTFGVPFQPPGFAIGLIAGAGLGIGVGIRLWRKERQPAVRMSAKSLAVLWAINGAVFVLAFSFSEILPAAGSQLVANALGVAMFVGLATVVLTIAFLDRRDARVSNVG